MEIEKMIAKKEDLINTYVKTDCEELVNLYLKKCKEFGFTWFSGKDINSSKANGSAVGLNEDVKLSVTNGSLDYFNDRNCRELSLSDFKPRTKTEFVKVTGSIFDLKDLLENEGLYFSTDTDEYDYCNNERDLCAAVYNGNIYRKVETEINERQEFIDTYASLRHEFHGQRTYDDFSGFMYDSGRFKLVE